MPKFHKQIKNLSSNIVEESALVHYVSYSFFLIGFYFSAIIGNNARIENQAVGLTFIGIAAMTYAIGLFFNKVILKQSSKVLGCFFVLASYFIFRALLSEVVLFAIKDIILVVVGLLTIILLGNLKLYRIEVVIFVLMILLSGASFVQYFEIDTPFYQDKRLDKSGLSSFFAHRIFFGDFIACLSLFSFSYFLLNERASKAMRIASICCFLLGVIQVVWSHSRGPFLVLISGSTVIAIFGIFKYLGRINSEQKSILSIFLPTISFIIIGFIYYIGTRLISRARFGEEYNFFLDSARVAYLKMALAIKMENPWIGGGANSYSYEAAKVVSAESFKSLQNISGLFAHNEYAQSYTDYGYIGLFLVIFFCISILSFIGYQLIFHKKNVYSKWYFFAGVAIIIGQLLHASVNAILHHIPNIIIFGLAISFCLRVLPSRRTSTLIGRLFIASLLFTLGMVMCTIGIVYTEVRQVQKSAFSKNGIERCQLLEKAATIRSDYRRFELLADAYRTTAINSSDSSSDHKMLSRKSVDAYKKSLELHPQNSNVYSKLINVLLLAYQYDEAERYVNDALITFSANDWHLGLRKAKSQIYYRRGLDFWIMGEYEASLAAFEKCDEIASSAKAAGTYNWKSWEFHINCLAFVELAKFRKSLEYAENFFFSREPSKALGAYELALKHYRKTKRLALLEKERARWGKLYEDATRRVKFLRGARIIAQPFSLPEYD